MTALFAAAIFLSSALLFWLEPLFGKIVLPLLGGTPAVWNACLLFYQTALLAGYAWAHAAERLGFRKHTAIHVALSIAAIAVLPFAVPKVLLPPSNDSPLGWLLLVLVGGVGLPFVMVAANGPLLQLWFSRSGSRRARDPYFLYAASNLGSAAALLLFPIVIERELTLSSQSQAWRFSYLVMLGLLAICAILLAVRRPGEGGVETELAPVVPEALALERKLRWLALAAIPSSLMLGVTTYISSEVAPIPLLWILPLALYLATLVLSFAFTRPLASALQSVFGRPLTMRSALVTLGGVLAVAVPCLAVFLIWSERLALVVAHLVLFAGAAMVCHVQLAADRPSAARLTEFYLWTAVGGAVGGAFNTLLGPALFTSVLEYPLALTAVIMALPARARRDGSRVKPTWSDLALPIALGLVTAAVPLLLTQMGVVLHFPMRLLLAIPALACLGFSGHPIRFGAGLAAVVIASTAYPAEIGSVELANRNFFGVHRVLRDDRHGFRWLTHGVTVHGGQPLADTTAPRPLTYFTPSGPAGDVFRVFTPAHPTGRVAVIGLGAGAMLYYGVPGQRWTFFEIDPAVTDIARNPRYFTFLSKSRAWHRIIGGDARLSLVHDSTVTYDMLVLDAFASDAIPTHLLTREAVRLYMSRLSRSGLLVMHISNRFFDLGPVVAKLAADAGLASLHRVDDAPSDAETSGKFASHWAVLARDPKTLVPLAATGAWQPIEGHKDLRVWTDDYSSVLPLLRNRSSR
ncbi:MAG TPA: fused MFS/spermidine synthase [Gemmatimonadaceae bacterium]|nr:fused MFS/spermidine synthase [Gemmatimonadaceae bacterium]